VLITLGPVSKARSEKVKIRGGLFVACLGAAGATYVLESRGFRWHIVGTSGGRWIAEAPELGRIGRATAVLARTRCARSGIRVRRLGRSENVLLQLRELAFEASQRREDLLGLIASLGFDGPSDAVLAHMKIAKR